MEGTNEFIEFWLYKLTPTTQGKIVNSLNLNNLLKKCRKFFLNSHEDQKFW